MAPLGPPRAGSRRDQGQLRRRGLASRAGRHQFRREPHGWSRPRPARSPRQGLRPGSRPVEGRGQEDRCGQEGRGREAQVDRLRRIAPAAVAAGQPRLDPRQLGGLQRRARPDRDQRARVERDLDHRPQHHAGRGRRPHRRPVGQGRRPALSMGESEGLSAGGREAQTLFAQHNAHWIPQGLPGEGHLLVFNNGGRRPAGNYSSVDELVLPIDGQGRYKLEPGAAFGPKKPVWSYSRRRSRISTRSSSRAPNGCPTATRSSAPGPTARSSR